uniref:Uncharacterized protein n=1 Tax=Arundo donax TaxID=35708 RepID=A0A0A9CHV7_ARUDO
MANEHQTSFLFLLNASAQQLDSGLLLVLLGLLSSQVKQMPLVATQTPAKMSKVHYMEGLSPGRMQILSPQLILTGNCCMMVMRCLLSPKRRKSLSTRGT